MKLSEAIMMNGMTKPQGFGAGSLYSKVAPCAIGGALLVAGRNQDYYSFWQEWPWTEDDRWVTCPQCKQPQPKPTYAIFHLNDGHHWTRAQIAEWVASIEPVEEPTLELQAPAVETTQEVVK